MRDPFRKMLSGGSGFFRSLPMDNWNALFAGFDEPEFRIGRAVASIVGQQKQANGQRSRVLPMLGSLLPLKLGQNGWYLPSKVSAPINHLGTDVCHDLAAVLARRRARRPGYTGLHRIRLVLVGASLTVLAIADQRNRGEL